MSAAVAQRVALLAGQAVPYRLERARRRSIGFTVGAQGLAVRAPWSATLGTVEAALQEKSAWIVRKLAEVRARVQAWLRGVARAHFTARLDAYAPRLGVRYQRLVLTSAATRWGSASASGTIRLNWRLMHHRAEVIDYVVVHELAHLREMNHSPRFWQIVQGVVPGHLQLRRELREQVAPGWDDK